MTHPSSYKGTENQIKYDISIIPATTKVAIIAWVDQLLNFRMPEELFSVFRLRKIEMLKLLSVDGKLKKK